MTRIDAVRAIADPLVSTRGFEIYDIDEHGPVVRVTVCGATRATGPGIDDLSAITKELSRALDAADPIDSRYTLEVSSPGLERRLRTPEHFRTAVGEVVSVKVREPDTGTRRIRGVLTRADDHGIEVRSEAEGDTEASPDSDTEIPVSYDTIDTARTVFEWGMTPPDDTESGHGEPNEAATRRTQP